MINHPSALAGVNTAAPADRPGSEVYKATVVDQMLTATDRGEPRIILSAQLQAKLVDAQDRAGGTGACMPRVCEVWITLADDNRLRMAVRDLDRLGFAADVSRLHPEHPDHHSLLDKSVHVRGKDVNGVVYWNLAWPREKPKPLAVGEPRSTASALKSKIAARRLPAGGTGSKAQAAMAPQPVRDGDHGGAA